MNQIAKELDIKLQELNPESAETLRRMVRDAMKRVGKVTASDGWPDGYFDEILGSIENETLERSPQGDLPESDTW